MKRLSVSVLILILLLLCACNAQKGSVSSDLPSETEPPVSESSENSSEDGEEPVVLSYEAMAKEIYESNEHSEYISLINELIEQYKDGTFVEVPNHHPPYPDDFPDAKSLPEATKKNVILCWRNEKQIYENSIEEGLIEYVYIIDENHAIALEPIKFAMSDGTTKLGFANTLYLECDINSYVSEVSEGFFGENS